MSEVPNLYIKRWTRVETREETIADKAQSMAYETGVFASMKQSEFNGTDTCVDGLLLSECGTAVEALKATIERLPHDSNDERAWVGYEPANSSCADCEKGCSVNVLWEDGRPTERVRALFYDVPDYDSIVTVNLKASGQSSE